jgi:sugar lactone lactonase YvrE
LSTTQHRGRETVRTPLRRLALATLGTLAVAAPGATAKPGDILVGDSGSDEILRVKPSTGATTVISDDPRFNDPNDVVVGRDGTLYVSDYEAFDGGGGVFSVNPRNGNARIVSDEPAFEQPDGLTLTPGGDLLVTDLQPTNAAVHRVALPSGNTTPFSTDPLFENGPLGVVAPPNGNPFVADENLLARVDPTTGDATTVADGSDGLMAGEGLVRAPDGTLYMADSSAGLQSIDPRTGEVRDLSGPVPYDDYGMAFDFRGRVLVMDGESITAVNPATGSIREVADGFDYAEGMEVEPPGCDGLTATIVGTTGRDKLKGSAFGDVIAGLGAADEIKGRGGRDVICGGGGPDQISGGAQNDRCFGQAGRDRERRC